ncbi:MAG TPA: CsgG/HfaB family protein [bacterium]|nr:CsgG/HfaB family protein [bacterium]
MKKLFAVSLAVLAGAALALPALGQESPGKKDTIFVGRVKVQPSVTELAAREGYGVDLRRIADSLETQFLGALNATRLFQLVDRSRVAEVQEEQAFGQVAVGTDAARIGRMTGAAYAFFPEVDGFQVRTDTDVYAGIGRESVTRRYFLSILVQVVDTTTGEVLPESPSIQVERVDSTGMAAPGQATASDRVLVDMAKEASGRLTRDLLGLLKPAKVLKVSQAGEGKIQLLINRGAQGGFGPGDMVTVYHYEAVTDEETGEVYRDKVPLCRARIIRGNDRQSTALSIGDDLGVTAGCIAEKDAAAEAGSEIPRVTWSGGEEDTGTGTAPVRVSPDTPGSGEQPLQW